MRKFTERECQILSRLRWYKRGFDSLPQYVKDDVPQAKRSLKQLVEELKLGSPPWASKKLKQLVKEGFVIKHGKGRGTLFEYNEEKANMEPYLNKFLVKSETISLIEKFPANEFLKLGNMTIFGLSPRLAWNLETEGELIKIDKWLNKIQSSINKISKKNKKDILLVARPSSPEELKNTLQHIQVYKKNGKWKFKKIKEKD